MGPKKGVKEKKVSIQAEAAPADNPPSEPSLRRTSRSPAPAKFWDNSKAGDSQKRPTLAEEPKPRKRTAAAAAVEAEEKPSVGRGKRRRHQSQDAPGGKEADDSCHAKEAAAPAQVNSPPCSPTRTRRRVEAQPTTRQVEDVQGGIQTTAGPARSPVLLAVADPGPFDPSKQEHISLCLSALSMEVPVSSGAAMDQPSAQPSVTGSTASGLQGAPYGRQQQFEQLFNAVNGACKDGVGRSIYISGLPGTGKSHTVRAVLRALHSTCPEPGPVAAFVSCFGQTDAGHIHAAILNQVALQAGHDGIVGSADSLPSEQAHHKLLSYLQDLSKVHNPSSKARKQGGSSSGSVSKGGSRGARSGGASSGGSMGGGRMMVVVLDEVDRLLSARSGIDNMTKLFMMPHATGVHCCVVAMANSIDITERCLPELKLRGCAPLFMPFGAYLRVQLLSILTSKLSALPWTVFDPTALELVARKVASSTGDVRKALQACRVALRILHEQSTPNPTSPQGGPTQPPPPAPTAAGPAPIATAAAPAPGPTVLTLPVASPDHTKLAANLLRRASIGAHAGTASPSPQPAGLRSPRLAKSPGNPWAWSPPVAASCPPRGYP